MFCAALSLKAIAKLVVMPPTSLLLLMAAGFIAARVIDDEKRALRFIARSVSVLAGLILALLSVPFVSFALLDSLQSARPIPPEARVLDAEAIVVLAGDVDCDPPEYGVDQPGALSLIRCRYGAQLAKRTELPLLIAGGVLRPDRRAISLVLEDFVEDELGVPVQWTEQRSTTTRQNAEFTAAILAPEGVKRVALVTHAWHMPRAAAAFRRAGLEVLEAPTAPATPPASIVRGLIPRMKSFRDSGWAIHEWIGRLWYAL